jgi:hypothetical protein
VNLRHNHILIIHNELTIINIFVLNINEQNLSVSKKFSVIVVVFVVVVGNIPQ